MLAGLVVAAGGRGGDTHRVKATREVILSGGTYNSPQLLQLSGIGSPELLRAHGIVGIRPVPASDLKVGDAIRADLWKKTTDVLDCLDRIGAHTPNRSGFPIIEVPLARHEDIDAAGRFLFENGIYVTLAAYPLVPRDEVGFRIQLTAANTTAQVEQLTDALGRLASRFDLQPVRGKVRAA